MTNPKRYAFCANESPHIRERADGVWVRWEDYEQLQAAGKILVEEGDRHLDQYNAEIEQLTTQRDHWLQIAREKDVEIERLRTENEKLLKEVQDIAARDAISKALQSSVEPERQS